MKSNYLDLMEKSLSAYTDEHILTYFNRVKTQGLTEHGFPRLTVNIGILISHDRRTDLLPVFLEMMEFCCKTIPTVKAANDFSVREIICCFGRSSKAGSPPRRTPSGGDPILPPSTPRAATPFLPKPRPTTSATGHCLRP